MELLYIALAAYSVGIVSILLPKKLELAAHYCATLAAIVGSGVLLQQALVYLLHGSVVALSGSVGFFTYNADRWSAVFLLIIGLAGTLTSIYAWGYAKGYLGKRLRLLGSLWNGFLLTMVLVLIAADVFSFLLAWELMAVVSFLLVNHEAEKKATHNAAYQYLVMTHIGTAAIMIAFLLVGSQTGALDFASMSKAQLSDTMRNAAFLTAFAGFALKSGLLPLHVWLPNAHPAAPSHVSALMSGVMLKIAVYGFGRFVFQFLGTVEFWWGALVLVVGLLSAVLGALYAQMEKDMKRVLAYSSVENMGLIFGAIGCGMVLLTTPRHDYALIGFLAAVVHSLNHSVMKSLLFMSAGSVLHATGSKDIEKMGGLAKLMPWTAGFTLIGSMGLAALPLTGGFVGEWLMLQSFVTLVNSSEAQGLRLLGAVALVLFGLASALAVGCFVRLYGVVFLGRARSKVVEYAHEADWSMRLGMGLAAVLVVVLGVVPGPVVALLQPAVQSQQALWRSFADVQKLWWFGSGSYAAYAPLLLVAVLAVVLLLVALAACGGKVFVRRDVTWNCGTYPTARQQYSATGFSKPLRRAFDFLLKPQRTATYLKKDHSYFGRQVEYKLTIPDQFTEKLYVPVQHYMVWSASFLRRIQQGSVRLYVSYVMVAMLLVLIWGAM
ncbi:proton-conducting transporter membrane subunit [Phascolarctobacterium sp.]|uniref:proton-conducting transporter transmembrane domain-containing protein n=1 Tax=Phascolarctobacterium sp. TaxID=2049039 RepID=UPI00302E6105